MPTCARAGQGQTTYIAIYFYHPLAAIQKKKKLAVQVHHFLSFKAIHPAIR